MKTSILSASPRHDGNYYVLAQAAIEGSHDQKVGVLISCEETYIVATQGVSIQFQELTRYLDHDLVGVVVGNGNSRGEIAHDPRGPADAARALAERFYTAPVTDYRLDTKRANRVW
ncbi:hypothetical protein [[Mycobacterium] wendilense]|uniref:Uncharacterized protein n=1 Tax=[Mycobacterium] wendilense TaxID=3064284 RepID=A0ABN9P7C3_9MYCO|nr:hypothetical protein [Mycolicibacterium sp. MU0050]CAJ1585902.1 hypothetical protein MU0050_003977 [Mycolicibacterium sp. MU0050]